MTFTGSEAMDILVPFGSYHANHYARMVMDSTRCSFSITVDYTSQGNVWF